MSLDVYLTVKRPIARERSGIFVREHGQIVEISRDEWDERNPGHEPVIVESIETSETAYDANITHNLGRMAAEAGIYEHCWRPEEIGITSARQLIEPLENAIALMEADPARFEKHNAPNGWGLYEHFVPWLKRYLAACKEYPDAEVRVSR